MISVFQHYARYYDLLYKDKDYSAEAKYILSLVQQYQSAAGSILELGCGTGTNSIWLARQGFAVTAIDLSETALDQARKKAGADACTFMLSDFLDDPLPGTDFGFVFDLGCLHGFTHPEHRDMLAGRVARCLTDDGCWLNISCSQDGPQFGPNRLSAREITAAVEPYFEILSLTATVLDNLSPEDREELGFPPDLPAPRAFCCLMRKRAPEDGTDQGIVHT